VIGGVFLAIVLLSPDGLLGLWSKLRSRFGPSQALQPPRRQA
jgi:branched-chain amino acid transport system permease protein